MNNPVVVGTYKCGCGFGPIRLSELLDYCAVHGAEIQNEYEVSENKEEGGEK